MDGKILFCLHRRIEPRIFRISNCICLASMKVVTKNCCCWKSTSGVDGIWLFAYYLRTYGRIFEIQMIVFMTWKLPVLTIWHWPLKHYYWKYFPFRIKRATTNYIKRNNCLSYSDTLVIIRTLSHVQLQILVAWIPIMGG